MTTPPLASTHDRICEAAIRIAGREGIMSMTLDNVAKEAGVSKGGLMYHFRSKDELVKAMLRHFGDQCEQAIMRRLAHDPEPRMRWARTMIDALMPLPNDARSLATPANAASSPSPAESTASDDGLPYSAEVMDRLMLTTLAMALNRPQAFEPMRAMGLRLRERLLSDPHDGMEQLLVWLVVDGLFLWRFLGMIDQQEPLYAQVLEKLRAKVSPAAWADESNPFDQNQDIDLSVEETSHGS